MNTLHTNSLKLGMILSASLTLLLLYLFSAFVYATTADDPLRWLFVAVSVLMSVVLSLAILLVQSHRYIYNRRMPFSVLFLSAFVIFADGWVISARQDIRADARFAEQAEVKALSSPVAGSTPAPITQNAGRIASKEARLAKLRAACDGHHPIACSANGGRTAIPALQAEVLSLRESDRLASEQQLATMRTEAKIKGDRLDKLKEDSHHLYARAIAKYTGISATIVMAFLTLTTTIVLNFASYKFSEMLREAYALKGLAPQNQAASIENINTQAQPKPPAQPSENGLKKWLPAIGSRDENHGTVQHGAAPVTAALRTSTEPLARGQEVDKKGFVEVYEKVSVEVAPAPKMKEIEVLEGMGFTAKTVKKMVPDDGAQSTKKADLYPEFIKGLNTYKRSLTDPTVTGLKIKPSLVGKASKDGALCITAWLGSYCKAGRWKSIQQLTMQGRAMQEQAEADGYLLANPDAGPGRPDYFVA